jgi:4-hydroxy-tetrahydrodipicolinate synthase
LKGDFAAARAAHYRLLPLFKAVMAETNPIGIKAAMDLLKLAGPEIRLPLTPMEAPNVARLEAALRAFGLLH